MQLLGCMFRIGAGYTYYIEVSSTKERSIINHVHGLFLISISSVRTL